MDNFRKDNIYDRLIEYPASSQNHELFLTLGCDENGLVLTQDLYTIPHFLVCGFTGAGKTTFIQSLLTQICKTKSPTDVKLIIFDSKVIDYNFFNGIPHLLLPVITDTSKMPGTMKWLEFEVQRRLKEFSIAGTKDLAGYNRKCNSPLPRVFIILDDFSSANLDAEAITALANVLKAGRVTGIHCVVVTSTPSSRTLQKDLISNLPCRISFCVSSRADSRVAIEQTGAENLQIPGEMIFKYQNIFQRCQATYIPFSDVLATMENLRQSKNANHYPFQGVVANVLAEDQRMQFEDELLPDAVDIILETGNVSVSILQRRLLLGYARAAHIIDLMELKGIIEPFQGSKPREILITKEQWDEMRGIAPNPQAAQQSNATKHPSVSRKIADCFAKFFKVSSHKRHDQHSR